MLGRISKTQITFENITVFPESNCIVPDLNVLSVSFIDDIFFFLFFFMYVERCYIIGVSARPSSIINISCQNYYYIDLCEQTYRKSVSSWSRFSLFPPSPPPTATIKRVFENESNKVSRKNDRARWCSDGPLPLSSFIEQTPNTFINTTADNAYLIGAWGKWSNHPSW